MIYAQINKENVCTVISDMGNIPIEKPSLIKLDFYDQSVIGKKYNNGVWEEVPQPEPEPSTEPTIDTLAKNQLTIMEAMAEQYEQNLENRLNDQEVQATIYEAVLTLSEGSVTK